MADFYGSLVSSQFRVKDDTAWLADPQVQRIRAVAQSEELFRYGFFVQTGTVTGSSGGGT